MCHAVIILLKQTEVHFDRRDFLRETSVQKVLIQRLNLFIYFACSYLLQNECTMVTPGFLQCTQSGNHSFKPCTVYIKACKIDCRRNV